MPLTTSTFSLFALGLTFVYPTLAQEQNVQFNQVANLNGDMQLNRLIFPDGTKIEAFSQTQRQILVNQNTAPLTANHVVGSTGQPFIQLSQNSMTIATNGATDLVGAQIEMPIQQATLDQNGITADNTFVAMLSPDRQTWMVMEGIKSVNTTDSTVRMIKLNALDGEYMAIGRQTIETSNVLSPFGQDPQQSIQVNGSGVQEVEFQDGFRMTIRASQPMTVNTDVVNGISSSMLVDGGMSVNNFRYLVRTNLAAVQPSLNQMAAVMQLPINANRVMQTAQRMGAGPNDMIQLGIEQRGVLQNPGGATGNLSPARHKRQDNTTDPATPTDATPTDATPTDATPTDATATDAIATDTTTTQDPNQGSSNSGNAAATKLLLAPTFTPITSRTVLDQQAGRIAATVAQLDGEYIVTMSIGAQGQAPQGGVQQPAPQGAQPVPQAAQPAPQGSSQQPAAQGTQPANPLGTPQQPTGANVPAPEPQAASPSAIPQPARRQTAPTQYGVTMSMSDLAVMVERQKNWGILPASEMITEYWGQQGQAVPAAQKLRRSNGREYRAKRFVV